VNIAVELSTDSTAGAIAADGLGVDRIELCSAGGLGGLTPGPGLLSAVLPYVKAAEVHVLIRPREGGFHYSPEEVEVLLADVSYAVSAGAAGVVVGPLTSAGDIDDVVLRELVDAAEGRTVTFHRAIDVCRDPVGAVEKLAEFGVARVLSSGQALRAEDGVAVLARMVKAAGSRLAVMACGGIRADNVLAVLQATGVTNLHAAPRIAGAAPALSFVDFGTPAEFDVAAAMALVRAVKR
jgi:copper homeostasis protein